MTTPIDEAGITPFATSSVTVSGTNGAVDPVRSADRTQHSDYRPDIDGLRAVAILSVLAFHAFPELVPGGFVGVDVFFVISGFLISRIILAGLRDGTFSFLHFYARRVRRIFPSLAVILAASGALGWLLLLPAQYESLGKHIVAGAGFVSNIALWKESGYFDGSAESKPLLHLWSLGIEEQFYIVFPLLLYFAWRLRSARLPLLLALGAVSFLLNIHLAPHDAPAAFYSPQTRFWELLAGCLLAYLGDFNARTAVAGATASVDAISRFAATTSVARNIASLGGIAAIAFAVFVVNRERTFPGWWALLPTSGAVLLLWAGAGAGFNRTLLSNRWMVRIGLISFQLYLWHWPLLAFTRIAGAGNASAISRALAIAISFPLAWATYAFIDKPIRSGRNNRIKTTAACCVLVVLGLAGYAVYALQGIPSRFPRMVQEIADFKYSYATAYREGTCFLRPEQDSSQFAACTDSLSAPGAPSVFLWGDSHAAHLYPGLKAAAKSRFELTQLTASNCPPIVGFDVPSRPHCREINAYAMARISAQHPQEVILAAHWGLYDWSGISETIDQLTRIGVERIVVVGPVPEWTDNLPALLSRYSRYDATWHRIPQRMTFGLAPGTRALDTRLAGFFARRPVTYVSVLPILCDDAGCLTRTSDDVTSMTAWDQSHLTDTGSRYVIAHFPDAVLPQAR
jgi:peptidoglycan/LPS O-acetylase OafA/YrhL